MRMSVTSQCERRAHKHRHTREQTGTKAQQREAKRTNIYRRVNTMNKLRLSSWTHSASVYQWDDGVDTFLNFLHFFALRCQCVCVCSHGAG